MAHRQKITRRQANDAANGETTAIVLRIGFELSEAIQGIQMMQKKSIKT